MHMLHQSHTKSSPWKRFQFTNYSLLPPHHCIFVSLSPSFPYVHTPVENLQAILGLLRHSTSGKDGHTYYCHQHQPHQKPRARHSENQFVCRGLCRLVSISFSCSLLSFIPSITRSLVFIIIIIYIYTSRNILTT